MSSLIGLRLDPLDVLFFRDGRAFTAAGHGASGLPTPQTLAGAIRSALLAALGCDFRKLRRRSSFRDDVRQALGDRGAWVGEVRFRGPWLARWCSEAPDVVEPLVAAPAVLHAGKKQDSGALLPLTPMLSDDLPGWRPPEDQQGLRPLWLRGRQATEPIHGFLTGPGLRAFVQGGPVGRKDVIQQDRLFDFDSRTGIGIDPDRLSAEEGLIYGAKFLALRPGVGFYAEVVLPAEEHRAALEAISLVALGGEGKRARLRVLPRPFDWPQPPPGGKPLVLLITPGLFSSGWRPGWLTAPPLVAAAVPSPIAISGWEMARGRPRPTQFAAPTGSVYFLDSDPTNPHNSSLCDLGDDANLGWGCFLKGAWIDA